MIMLQIKSIGVGEDEKLLYRPYLNFPYHRFAAGAACHAPSLIFEIPETARRYLHFYNKTIVTARFNLYIEDMGIIRNDSFRNRETNSKLFQMLRRAHHYNMRKAVINQCDRNFFRNKIRLFLPRRKFDYLNLRLDRRQRKNFFLQFSLLFGRKFTQKARNP